MDAAGVVLAGGRSTRMGRPKADLTWRGGTLLGHVTAVVAEAVGGPVVVVRGPDQRLPTLSTQIEVIADPVPGLGPLQGLATGLAAVASRADVAFVAATDLPFLHPAFVRRLIREMAVTPVPEVVVPVVGGHRQPLVAVYAVGLGPRAGALLAGGHRSAMSLLDASQVRELEAAALLADPELAAADPELDSLRDVNDAAAYREALESSDPAP